MRRHLNVLLVEDDDLGAKAVSMALTHTDAHIHVERVRTLNEAKERVKSGGIDVILTDLVLPDAKEADAVKVFRQTCPDIPVVALSGAGEELEQLALEAGAQDYLRKAAVPAEGMVTVIRHSVIRHEVDKKFRPVEAGMEKTDEVIKAAEILRDTMGAKTP